MKIRGIKFPLDEKHPYWSGVLFGIVCSAITRFLLSFFNG